MQNVEIASGLVLQQQERTASLEMLARLRHEALAEIDRLIAFLDASDPYVTTELEAAVDDGPCDWDELEQNLGRFSSAADGSGDLELDDSDDEPSLGLSESIDQLHASEGSRDDREGDEHDGGEPGEDDEPSVGFDEGEQDTADDEPSLGWTEEGQHGGSYLVPDGEIGAPARTAQRQFKIGKGVTVHRHFRRELHGLTERQRQSVRARKRGYCGVIVR